jgi:hypothetical protein
MKRYQAVSIERRDFYNRNIHEHVVAVHDRIGGTGIKLHWYYNLSKTELIKQLRMDGIEVSKHVENGGELRTH